MTKYMKSIASTKAEASRTMQGRPRATAGDTPFVFLLTGLNFDIQCRCYHPAALARGRMRA